MGNPAQLIHFKKNSMMLKIYGTTMMLFIILCWSACHPGTNNITVIGDSAAAARLYRDTSSPLIYVSNEDSAMLIITGKHWPAGLNDSAFHVFLDNRELHTIIAWLPSSTGFTFRLPNPVQIRMHQLRVSLQQSNGATISAGINFSVKSRGD
jgi:hypothetical protein